MRASPSAFIFLLDQRFQSGATTCRYVITKSTDHHTSQIFPCGIELESVLEHSSIMPNTSLVLNHLLPGDAVALGRLVLNIQSPQQEFYQPDPPIISADDITTQRLTKFNETLGHEKGSRVFALLSRFLHSSYGSESMSSSNISTALYTKYILLNSGDIFSDICEQQRARSWLQGAIARRRSVFMVVGLTALKNAQVRQQQGRASDTEVRAQIPISQAVSGGVAGLGDALDVGAGAALSTRTETTTSFIAPGEQIFAVQYRRVEFERFSRRRVDSAFLESGNRWQVYMEAKGGEEESDEIQVIEAGVSDGLQRRDLGGGSYEELLLSDDEFLFPS